MNPVETNEYLYLQRAIPKETTAKAFLKLFGGKSSTNRNRTFSAENYEKNALLDYAVIHRNFRVGLGECCGIYVAEFAV